MPAAIFAAWFAMSGATTARASLENLTYVLAPLPNSGQIRVQLTWQTRGREQSALSISPRWGNVNDVPGLLRGMRWAGDARQVRRDDSAWIVQHRRGGSVQLEYLVDTGLRTLDWDTTHYPVTTREFFHGVGNTFLLAPATGGGTPDNFEVIVRWQLPAGWEAVCSWGVGATVGSQLTVTDLRHSVYLAGRLERRVVSHGGQRVQVAMVDRFKFQGDAFAELSGRIIRAQCAFMQEPEFPEFVVTAAPVGAPLPAGQSKLAGSGLYNSFALFLAPGAGLNDAVEHLFAHELFHFWNGRLLRGAEPDELVYWFTEGFTDYYALRIQFESGLWKAGQLAEWINRHLLAYQRNPARNATNEQIRARFWTERETFGETPYQRGLALGLRWHRMARDRGTPDGLDRLLRRLMNRARAGDFELTNSAVRTEGHAVYGQWFVEEFDKYVIGAETVPVPLDALAPALTGAVTPVYEYLLGFDLDASLKAERVSGLLRGAVAERAGLREGDRLLAWAIPDNADEPVVLRVRRGDRELPIQYFPRGARTDTVQFKAASR